MITLQDDRFVGLVVKVSVSGVADLGLISGFEVNFFSI